MFNGAVLFDQDISNFLVTNINYNGINDMVSNCGISTANYDALLASFVPQIPLAHGSNTIFTANGCTYSSAGAVNRNILTTTSPLWLITGDSLV